MGPGNMWDLGWGAWLVGLLVLLLFWGTVIALTFLAIRALNASGRSGKEIISSANSALEILKQRYARGEITREEYLAMRRDLEA